MIPIVVFVFLLLTVERRNKQTDNIRQYNGKFRSSNCFLSLTTYLRLRGGSAEMGIGSLTH